MTDFHTPNQLRKELGGKEYGTKTRGRQKEMAARAVGEGRYVLAQHAGHSHLACALEQPKTPKEIQKDLRVEDEGFSQTELVKELKLQKGKKRLEPVEEGKWD